MPRVIEDRKAEHVALALAGAGEVSDGGWADVDLVHDALPKVDLDEIDLTTTFLGAELRFPMVIPGMTGGHPDAELLNMRLGAAAQRHGIAVGVGSQRAWLHDRSLEPTYNSVRRCAPDAYVIANIGAAQLIAQSSGPAVSVADLRRIVAAVEANALAIHLNFLEEAIQPEGDRRARGCDEAIARACESLDVPVIAKETGGGMTAELATRLRELGVSALDVGGAGGTSFAAIERLRAARQHDARGESLGETFATWGIPTPAAVSAAMRVGLPTVATGGLRSGLDVCKALALGATTVGIARPALAAATKGDEALDVWFANIALELRTAMFLTGCRNTAEARAQRVVLHGRMRDWIDDLSCAGHPPAAPRPAARVTS